MNIQEGFKRLYANDLAAGLGFEWDYTNARDYDLYEALEANGYMWDGTNWLPVVVMQPRQRVPSSVDMEKLAAWNEGKPL